MPQLLGPSRPGRGVLGLVAVALLPGLLGTMPASAGEPGARVVPVAAGTVGTGKGASPYGGGGKMYVQVTAWLNSLRYRLSVTCLDC